MSWGSSREPRLLRFEKDLDSTKDNRKDGRKATHENFQVQTLDLESHELPHLTVTAHLWGRFYYYYFTSKIVKQKSGGLIYTGQAGPGRSECGQLDSRAYDFDHKAGND